MLEKFGANVLKSENLANLPGLKVKNGRSKFAFVLDGVC